MKSSPSAGHRLGRSECRRTSPSSPSRLAQLLEDTAVAMSLFPHPTPMRVSTQLGRPARAAIYPQAQLACHHQHWGATPQRTRTVSLSWPSDFENSANQYLCHMFGRRQVHSRGRRLLPKSANMFLPNSSSSRCEAATLQDEHARDHVEEHQSSHRLWSRCSEKTYFCSSLWKIGCQKNSPWGTGLVASRASTVTAPSKALHLVKTHQQSSQLPCLHRLLLVARLLPSLW